MRTSRLTRWVTRGALAVAAAAAMGAGAELGAENDDFNWGAKTSDAVVQTDGTGGVTTSREESVDFNWG